MSAFAELPVRVMTPLWLLLLTIPIAFLSLSIIRHLREERTSSNRGAIIADLLRFASMTLLILTLAGFSVVNSPPNKQWIVLVDDSFSIGETGRAQIRKILQGLSEDTDANRKTTRLEFASSCRTPSLPVAPSPDLQDTWRAQTNIAEALRTAILNAKAEEQTAILLISDGLETVEDAVRTAALSPIPITTYPLQPGANHEVELQELILPPVISKGEPVQIQVLVHATDDCETAVRCVVDGVQISDSHQRLHKGSNTLLLTHRFPSDAELTVELTPRAIIPETAAPESNTSSTNIVEPQPVDTFLQNNSCSRSVATVAPLKVLVIDTTPAELESFAALIEAEGIDCDLSLPAGLPTSQSELNHYGVVILSGVPATDLTPEQQTALQTWVEFSGGGLLMTGGDRSFGPGGYYQSPVEQVLPVRCDFVEEQEKPSVGLVLVIDKSGSMSGPKMELARDAAKAAVELLSPSDSLGIIAFDGEPVWIRKPAPLIDREATIEQIGRILPGGGTALYPALVEVQREIQALDTRLRHILVLTDGYSTEGEFERIAQELNSSGVTISAAGLGDADRALVELLARVGRGRHYFTQDPKSVPQIFARETMLAGSSSLREEPFVPTIIRQSPSLLGIPFSGCPPLHGYVRTRSKPGNEVLLSAPNGDPLLSWWRTGSGWGAAFTSDLHPRWSREWFSWNSGGRFWAQLLRQIQRIPPERIPRNVVSPVALPLKSKKELFSSPADAGLLQTISEISGGLFDPAQERLRELPASIGHSRTAPVREWLIPIAFTMILFEVWLRRKT